MPILAGIQSLVQHVQHFQSHPDDYRPDRCPHCGMGGLWHHGTYVRQSNRRGLQSSCIDPILIPRFLCQACHRTCSCLPEVIPPRRWYLWDLQQHALVLLLSACTLNRLATQLRPCRQTLKRWWQRLQSRFDLQASSLRSHFADLGRTLDFTSFWSTCLDQMPLSHAMLVLHREGVDIP